MRVGRYVVLPFRRPHTRCLSPASCAAKKRTEPAAAALESRVTGMTEAALTQVRDLHSCQTACQLHHGLGSIDIQCRKALVDGARCRTCIPSAVTTHTPELQAIVIQMIQMIQTRSMRRISTASGMQRNVHGTTPPPKDIGLGGMVKSQRKPHDQRQAHLANLQLELCLCKLQFAI